MENEMPAGRLHFVETFNFTYRTFTQQRTSSRWRSDFLSLSVPWALEFYPLSLFLSFVFNCRKSRRAACSLAEGRKKNLPNYIALKTFIFSSLTPPTWKTKTQLNSLYSFWRWEGTFLSPAAMEINTTVYNWVQLHTSHSKTHTDITSLHERTPWLSFQ